MTDDRMALIELIEKGAGGDLVRELLAFAAERRMELEVEARTGAPAGARSPDRLTTGMAIGSERGRRAQAGLTSPSQTAQGLVSALVPGAPAHSREGAHRRDPGSLRAQSRKPSLFTQLLTAMIEVRRWQADQ